MSAEFYRKDTAEGHRSFARVVRKSKGGKLYQLTMNVCSGIAAEKAKLMWLKRGMSFEALDWLSDLEDRINDLEIRYEIIKRLR